MRLTELLLAGKGSGLVSFFSVIYLAGFLPLSVIGFSLTPKKAKKYYLLAVSYLFFWLISGVLVLYPAFMALLAHYFGLWLDRIQQQMRSRLAELPREERKAAKKGWVKKQRAVVTLAVLLMAGGLLTLKYVGFFTGNLNSLLSLFGAQLRITVPAFVLPIGISFFTLQTLSYVLDVYRGAVKADGNLARVALFVSFCPQMVEGPISRYSEIADGLWNVSRIRFEDLSFGLQRIFWGMLKKIVIADRLNPLIKNVFDTPGKYQGGVIAVAAVCYTVQLYMEFSGTMDVVLGTAQIFGVRLPENFQRPFFSRSVSEFWKRWHITLGAWFRDYIFYPVTASGKMKKLTSFGRKKLGNHYGPLLAGAVALFCVWLANGLWHGAAWSFIFFGMYHFALILGGNLITPPGRWLCKKLRIDPECLWFRAFQTVRTTLFVIVGELFFRAPGLRAGMGMFRQMVTDFRFPSLNDALLRDLGVDAYDLIIVGVTLAIVFAVGVIQEKGTDIRASLAKKPLPVRWAVLYALILYIAVFGAYGYGYVPVDPIYAQF